MWKRLWAWLKAAGANSESDTVRNGFLSYSGEYHAAIIGAVVGLTVALTGDPTWLAALLAIGLSRKVLPNEHLRDVRHELAYAAGGVVVMWLLASGGMLLV